MTTPTNEGLELIALSHHVNVEYLTDTVSEMRGRLDNRLGGFALEAVKESEMAVTTRQFLEDCVGVLPRPQKGNIFTVDNQADVRWLHNSVMWVGYNGYVPHYILGEINKGLTTELLLHGAQKEDDNPLLIVEMSRRAYHRLHNPVEARLGEPLSQEEMNRLFHKGLGQFAVGPAEGMHTRYHYPRNLWAMAERAAELYSQPIVKEKGNISTAVYASTLARFRVANNLSYLALAFGKEAEMSDVIKRYTPDSTSE